MSLKPRNSHTGDFPTDDEVELPAGWRVVRRDQIRARFGYGSHLVVEIEPRLRVTRSNRNPAPSAFRVLLRKRFHGRGVSSDANVLGTVDSFEAALDVAHRYMAEFVEDRREIAMETRAELEADPVMAAESEETIITEAATEAAISVAGYSDDLLINDLRGLLENGENEDAVLQAVVHQDGDQFEVVYVNDEYQEWTEGRRLRRFYKQFDWLDEQKLQSTLSIGKLELMIGVFEETRMVRYLASQDRETLILIDPEYPLHVPPFERQVADIISARWEPDG